MELTLAAMARDYLPWNLDQRLLLPVDMREWLPEGHLALFILDVVSELDLSDITATYEAKELGRNRVQLAHRDTVQPAYPSQSTARSRT